MQCEKATGPRGNSVTRSGVVTRGYGGPYRYRGYRYGGVATGVAVVAAVCAAAATSAYVAPAPAYYGPRPNFYAGTLAHYRPY